MFLTFSDEFWKQEMELSKQEMELFHLLPELQSKNVSNKIFLTLTNESKSGKRKLNYSNREWNSFSYFQVSDQKTSFTKFYSFSPRSSKLIFKTGNGIIQTGNEIISLASTPLINKLLLQIFLNFTKESKIDFQNRKYNYLNRKWNYISCSDQKISFSKIFSFSPRSPKFIF